MLNQQMGLEWLQIEFYLIYMPKENKTAPPPKEE